MSYRGNTGLIVAPAEDCRAGNEHIGARLDDARGRFGCYAAVNLDIDRSRSDQRTHLAQLVDCRRDEGLSAKAGID